MASIRGEKQRFEIQKTRKSENFGITNDRRFRVISNSSRGAHRRYARFWRTMRVVFYAFSQFCKFALPSSFFPSSSLLFPPLPSSSFLFPPLPSSSFPLFPSHSSLLLTCLLLVCFIQQHISSMQASLPKQIRNSFVPFSESFVSSPQPCEPWPAHAHLHHLAFARRGDGYGRFAEFAWQDAQL
jgi:hypothetical protein